MAKKRIINITVENEYVIGSGVVIGAAGSHDDVALSITFGEVWDGLTLQATFRDAKGENPTVIMILPSMLVAGTTRTYLVTIPVEAKRYEGKAILVLSGYTVTKSVDGEGNAVYSEDTCTNTATAYFRVLPSDFALADDGSVTPTLAEQLTAGMNELAGAFADQMGRFQTLVDTQLMEQDEAIADLEEGAEKLKEEVDGKVDGKVDRYTESHTSSDVLYGQKSDGTDAVYQVALSPQAFNIPRYNKVTVDGETSIVLKTQKPLADNDCANKEYVDDAVETIERDIETALDELHAYAQALVNGGNI